MRDLHKPFYRSFEANVALEVPISPVFVGCISVITLVADEAVFGVGANTTSGPPLRCREYEQVQLPAISGGQ